MLRKIKAFTLIELLVVVLIIGILAAVAVPQYQLAVDKSRMTQAFMWAKSIRDAEQAYYLANGEFTENLEELDVSFPGCTKQHDGYYICADDFAISLSAKIPSVYVYLPSNWLPAETGAAVEYNLSDTSLRLCYANSQRFQKVCKSLGGTVHPVQANYFILH